MTKQQAIKILLCRVRGLTTWSFPGGSFGDSYPLDSRGHELELICQAPPVKAR